MFRHMAVNRLPMRPKVGRQLMAGAVGNEKHSRGAQGHGTTTTVRSNWPVLPVHRMISPQEVLVACSRVLPTRVARKVRCVVPQPTPGMHLGSGVVTCAPAAVRVRPAGAWIVQ